MRNRTNHLRRLGRYLPLFLLGASLTASTRPAEARAEEALTYTKLQSFQAALRFLRVDNGYNVLEKDQDSGYLLFEYPSRDRSTPGSIEIIEREDTIAVVVQLPQMPSYHERHLIEGLLNKLRSDYGAPPERAKPKPPQEDSKKAPPKAPLESPPGEPDVPDSQPKEKQER